MIDIIAHVRGLMYVLWCKCFKKNVNIGNGFRIYKKLKISGEGKVNIGDNCIIDGIIGDNSQYVCIESYNRSSVVSIGDNVKLYAARLTCMYKIIIGSLDSIKTGMW